MRTVYLNVNVKCGVCVCVCLDCVNSNNLTFDCSDLMPPSSDATSLAMHRRTIVTGASFMNVYVAELVDVLFSSD